MKDMKRFGIRGAIFDLVADPGQHSSAWRYFEDGILVIADGRIEFAESAVKCAAELEDQIPIFSYPNCLICPGFVDTHIHYSQTQVIGSPAPGLLEWLETYTFPEELRFDDAQYAAKIANQFFDELLKNGTTSAQVFPTVHEISADVFFDIAHQRNLRMVAGKVLMDRNAPPGLRDGDDLGESGTERLIRKWHGTGRQTYSITLRFAGTSTREQMALCTKLVQQNPELLFHTHLSETLAEIDWTLGLYPECSDYLGVYEQYGVVTDRSVFAHSIHLSDSEKQRLADAGAAIALCPTSNLFLGSGLAPVQQLAEHHIGLSLGTDVGGGTSFSMLQTMHEMYKVMQIGDSRGIGALELFYLATLGGAQALKIDSHVGNFDAGKEADFVILDAGGQLLVQDKLARARTLEELLFTYVILGSSASTKETWSMGQRVYQRDSR